MKRGHRMRVKVPHIEEFLERLIVVGECWNLVGTKQAQGYSVLDKNRMLAHRFSYEYFVAKIPKPVGLWDGIGRNKLHIHHKCKNRWCVNPDHLELKPYYKHASLHFKRT